MLTQAEADRLLAVKKRFPTGLVLSIEAGSKLTVELESEEPAEQFVLDAYRGRIRLRKVTLQNRVRTNVILARLDLNGSPHTNPDGEVIRSPHLHVYRKGFDDKWAWPLDPEQFSNPDDVAQAFIDFCDFCAITELPEFQESLL